LGSEASAGPISFSQAHGSSSGEKKEANSASEGGSVKKSAAFMRSQR
jgi:hypothetical protein